MITHHPPSEIMVDYAAGSLPEPLALLLAAHLSLCPACRDELHELENVGGALLEQIEPAEIDDAALDAVLARLDEPEPPPHAEPNFDLETRQSLPEPVRSALGKNLSECRWHWRGPSMREILLPVSVPGWQVSLFRVRPGGTVPPHGHGGQEYTLVLSGGLTDRTGGLHITRGDVEVADTYHTHRQFADDDEECLCLAVLDAPVKLKGPLGWVANPFLRS